MEVRDRRPGPDDLRAETTFPTTTPQETIGRAAAFFEANEPVAALGIGSFGPVDLGTGHVTTTPKPGWANTPLAPELEQRLGVPVAFDTDVNAAALGEHRWGAAQGLDTFVYLTVGTGIGGGVMAGGELVHGLSHPEFGHLRPARPRRGSVRRVLSLPRRLLGRARPGRASRPLGPAGRARRAPGSGSSRRTTSRSARLVIAILSPQLVLGGGVGRAPALLPLVRRRVDELLAGYVRAPEIVHPALGDRSGVLGAIALARQSRPGARAGAP